MTPIPFFTDTITIVPHTASDASRIGRPITIREFVGERRCGLFQLETGDLLCRVVDGSPGYGPFIEGPER